MPVDNFLNSFIRLSLLKKNEFRLEVMSSVCLLCTGLLTDLGKTGGC